MTLQTLFESFLDYCDEDNPQLKADIKTWLADFFDLKHRTCKLDQEEYAWIIENLTPESQIEILGKVITKELVEEDE